MIPITLQPKLDTLISDLTSQLTPAQSAYLAAHSKYWQGAATHSAIPADGATKPSNLDAKTLGGVESWKDVGIALPTETEASFSVDAYQSRSGPGYILRADIIINGVRHRRSVNFGPHAWLESNWTPFKTITMP